MSAVLDTQEAWFEPLTQGALDLVLRVEQSAYEFPWTRGNFSDSLMAGHRSQLLRAGDDLLGYFVAADGEE